MNTKVRRSFSEVLTLSTFVNVIESLLKVPNEDSARFLKGLELFRPFIGAYLATNAKQFPPIANKRRVTRFTKNWHALITLDHEPDKFLTVLDRLVDFFQNLYITRFKCPVNAACQDVNTIQTQYDNIVKFMDEGTFDYCELNFQACENTDMPIFVGFENWTPKLYVLIEQKFVPLDDDEPEFNSACSVEVHFPSGELLIADWFRINEFTNPVRETRNSMDAVKTLGLLGSLNSSQGRMDHTNIYAQEFNFVSVSVDNTCPTLFFKDNTMVFNNLHLDTEDWDDCLTEKKRNEILGEYTAGSMVCTDLWNVTIIDRVTLVNIITRYTQPDGSNCTDEEAQLIIDGMISGEGHWDVQQHKVEPGKYVLFFDGNSEQFKYPQNTQYEFPKFPAMFCVVKKKENE